MARKSNCKPGPIYDENGRWVEEHPKIKGAIRVVFRQSPQMKEAKDRARVELPPKIKKDGEPGKKNQVFYRCAACGKLFKDKDIRIDHINPVVPYNRREADMSYDELARAIFCKIDNLQVLCSTKVKQLPKGEKSCHTWKTIKENWIRDRWFETKKPLVELEQEYEVHLANQISEILEKAKKRQLREEKKKLKI